MKKIYFLLLLLPFAASATVFPGNGNTGFGGAIGQSSLNITDDGTTITFTVTKGPGNFNDALVLYIDNLSGSGFTTTSGLLDDADGLRSATSGYNGGNKTTINFPAGFTPQYALAVSPAAGVNFAALFQLVNGGSGSLAYVTSGNLTAGSTSGSATTTFSIPASAIGGLAGFNFIGTYTSTTAYLSDEAIGYALQAGNPAFNATINPATYDTYTSVLAVNLLQFSGTANGANAALSWRTATPGDIDHFEIQQSFDGINFSDIAAVSAGNSPSGDTYYRSVPGLKAGNNYYRLRIVNANGISSFSNISDIKFGGGAAVIVYGNPVKDQVRFSLENSSSRATAFIYAAGGRLISTENLGGGPNVVYTISTAQYPAGLLFMKVITADGQTISARIIKE